MVPDVKDLYRNLVKDYFISRMFTEKQSILISKQPLNVIDKFIELERVKTQDEILNTLDKINIPIKKAL